MDNYRNLIRNARQYWKIGLSILILLGSLFSTNGLIAQTASAAPAITITVNTTTDTIVSDNFISLREAILLVNGGTGGDGLVTGLGRALSASETGQITGGVIGAAGVAANILFTDLPGSPTIALSGGTGTINESLPPILTSGVVIDGLSGVGIPVKIDGSGIGVPVESDILWLGWATDATNAIQVSNITISNVFITGAKRYGIHLNPASNSFITDCTVTQSTSFAIFIQGKFGDANTNTIQGCNVGGNASLGIVINRPGANHNTITKNQIGTDASGTSAWPNTGAGIALFTGTHDNLITGNLISG
ncbi:MAG TPA: right-handed parallel beta-helix repeat-containing protein, partial [Anaerolineales bacterium]